MWNRSTDQSVVPPPLGATSAQPDSGSDAVGAGRRKPWRRIVFVGILVALLGGIAFGVTAYLRNHEKHVAASRARASVRAAYLHFYSALQDGLRQGNVAALASLTTAAGLKQQQDIVAQANQSGYRYAVQAEHHTQTVVYPGGTLASVDDILVRTTQPVNQSDLRPAGPGSTDTIQESVALSLEDGHWLVDSITIFGASSQQNGFPVSYAAASPDSSVVSSASNHAVASAYDKMLTARQLAFKKVSASPLQGLESGSALSLDTMAIHTLRANHQAFAIIIGGHNYRIGEQDVNTIWIYDTYPDSSHVVDQRTGKLVDPKSTEFIRKGFQFQRVGERWVLEYVGLYE